MTLSCRYCGFTFDTESAVHDHEAEVARIAALFGTTPEEVD